MALLANFITFKRKIVTYKILARIFLFDLSAGNIKPVYYLFDA